MGGSEILTISGALLQGTFPLSQEPGFPNPQAAEREPSDKHLQRDFYIM